MSKEAALRAMREAAYAERTARSAGGGAAPKKAAAPKRPAAAKASRTDEPSTATATDGLCGHRSMNGRSCTREQGHAAKSHRYG
jgi:hypothetical protein